MDELFGLYASPSWLMAVFLPAAFIRLPQIFAAVRAGVAATALPPAPSTPPLKPTPMRAGCGAPFPE